MYTREEDEQIRVVAYVKTMNLDQLMQPLDKERIAAELNIQNPLVIDLVQ